MGQMDWLRSHVERCMQGIWDDADLEVDEDGDYPFASRTGMGWIRVSDGRPRTVSVTVMAVTGLRSTAALLREINHITGRARGLVQALDYAPCWPAMT